MYLLVSATIGVANDVTALVPIARQVLGEKDARAAYDKDPRGGGR